MPTYEGMLEAFGPHTCLSPTTRYCRVFGPHRDPNVDTWFFNIEKSGALSVANDITFLALAGHVEPRPIGNNGRFTDWLTSDTIDAVWGPDLGGLVEAVLHALHNKPGAW